MHKNAKQIFSIAIAVVTMCFGTTQMAIAQQNNGSSNMAFSPYTMYGIGDLINLGSASSMSMGGVGLGMRSSLEINYLNPASLSALSQQSSLFSFGARSSLSVSKTKQSKSGYSTMDISDIGFAVPLYRGIGLSFSLTPVSAVGYSSTLIKENTDISSDIGRSVYKYYGDGGISQVSMGLGVMIVRGFSLGGSVNYYFGNINRNNSVTILPMLGQTTAYRSLTTVENIHISDAVYTLGGQYSWRVGSESALTLGATYQFSNSLNAHRSLDQYTGIGSSIDTLASGRSKYDITLPAKISAGLYFVSSKVSLGFDWSRQDWSGAFDLATAATMKLGTQSDYKLGMSYCPNLSSLSSPMKRWTYKLGVHYSQSYLIRDNDQPNDYGITAGVDIPLLRTAGSKARGYSKISVGVDVGRRGSYKVGQVQETYYKAVVGLSLFGGDYWFVKQKFK